jgi:hypothetical protein
MTRGMIGVFTLKKDSASADAARAFLPWLNRRADSLPLASLVSPISSASLHPPQAALLLRSPGPSDASVYRFKIQLERGSNARGCESCETNDASKVPKGSF